MARTGRPVAEVVLTDDERETLLRWSRRAKSSQSLALRSRIVLGCAEGKANKQVAAELGVWPQTVGTWRRRFVEARLDGLVDEPRPGAPRTITDEQIEQVVVATLERTPADATHWSRASMAAESGLCQIKLVGSFAVVQQRGQGDKFIKSINIHNKSAPFKK